MFISVPIVGQNMIMKYTCHVMCSIRQHTAYNICVHSTLPEQVLDGFVVDLHEGCLHLIRPALLLQLVPVRAHLLHGPRDDAAHRALARALHGVRLREHYGKKVMNNRN
jgi:hypothetical protein